MSTLMEELTAIKTVEDKLTANKVANFAYTDTAYSDPATYADGVQTYDPDAEQNIPVANASVLKVNATILTKGWRAQASSITRMLMNHFLGRCSYNLNKINDLFSLLLTKLMAFMGQPEGIAMLDSTGSLYQAVGSDKIPITKSFLGAMFGTLLGRYWNKMSGGINGMNSVLYANGLWVASSQGCWWSEDGKNWVQGTGNNTSIILRSVTYANGLWLVGSAQSGIWWSEDGKSWTQVEGDTATYGFTSFAYADNLWVGASIGHGIWWSYDGKNWSQGGTGSVSANPAYVVYHNELWVASDRSAGIWWSEDGKNWTQGTGVSSATSQLSYGKGVWVAKGANDILWSEDGKAWSQGTGVSSPGQSANELYYAGGFWVLGLTSVNGFHWSTDGKNWTQRTGIGFQLSRVYFANGLWVAGQSSSAGKIWWSKDLETWSEGMTSEGINTLCIYYANGIWLVGEDTDCWYSSIDDLIADGTVKLGEGVHIVD